MPGLVPGIHVCQPFRMAGGWVYIITNKPNGILYVGVTSDIRKRAWKVRTLLAANPDWQDLYDDLA